jgi:hypothetical protein
VRKKEISVGKIEDDKCMEDGMGRGHVFFFSRDRRFVSSDFLLASLTTTRFNSFTDEIFPSA